MRHFRVYGQPKRSRVHWHVHKSSLPEEENKDELATLGLQVVQVVRTTIMPPPLHYYYMKHVYYIVAAADAALARTQTHRVTRVHVFCAEERQQSKALIQFHTFFLYLFNTVPLHSFFLSFFLSFG